jgi:general nucleoside transport system permease protein
MRTLEFLASVLRISMPYALAALGGTWSERSGVVNIALEGLLLLGAFAATLAAFVSHSGAVGVLAGVGAGVVISALYALLVLRLRGDPIVCGVAINLLADGVSRFFLKTVFDSSSNSPRVDSLAGSDFQITIMVITLALIIGSQWIMSRTAFGLRVRACGEHPEAAASVGIRVARVRWLAVLLGGALAGLGGAWMVVDQRKFVAGMSNGRGYIALAAMIFGKWRPAWAAAAALLFGLAEATQIALQTSGIGVPAWVVQMLPYVLTIVTLAGLIGRAKPPKALGHSLGKG